ncbi:ABC transporter [Pilimelia columellifera]|uniref:ABC transporter n=1 Tax=Pilimelia columellifera TaxID=706574 RepID=UPI003CD0B59A
MPAQTPPPASRDGATGLPPGSPPDALIAALDGLRSVIASVDFALTTPSAAPARDLSGHLVHQVDDYLLPRLRRLDAPVLVVVGGSTGAGKSTLVNSLVQAPVTASGVLRPTTRCPVLVCHPDDAAWFRTGDLLPDLTRVNAPTAEPGAVQLVPAPALPAGLALLDAPDIDSVADDNRALAGQLLAAADLWLFVTTAARYADAVPWTLLSTARRRGAVIALVLDRTPAGAQAEVAGHLREMLVANGLESAPLFVVPETGMDGQGLLPETDTAPLRQWLAQLAEDADMRAGVVRQTLDGALAALGPDVDLLAAAAADQHAAATTLTEKVNVARQAAREGVAHAVKDGALLRGEVLARWQDFVGSGDLVRNLEAQVGRARDRVVAALTGRPAPGRQLRGAMESGLSALLRGAAADAVEQARQAWRHDPVGVALLDAAPTAPTADLHARVERLVRDWQRAVLELVRSEGADKRARARGAAYAVNATSLAVMIAVFASTAFVPTGAEVAAAGGVTIAGQKVLEAIFGDQAIRALAEKARLDLDLRTNALLRAELDPFAELLPERGVAAARSAQLRTAGTAVAAARANAGLSADGAAPLPAWEGDE